VLHDVLDSSRPGCRPASAPRWRTRMGDAVARRRDARDGERYRAATRHLAGTAAADCPGARADPVGHGACAGWPGAHREPARRARRPAWPSGAARWDPPSTHVGRSPPAPPSSRLPSQLPPGAGAAGPSCPGGPVRPHGAGAGSSGRQRTRTPAAVTPRRSRTRPGAPGRTVSSGPGEGPRRRGHARKPSSGGRNAAKAGPVRPARRPRPAWRACPRCERRRRARPGSGRPARTGLRSLSRAAELVGVIPEARRGPAALATPAPPTHAPRTDRRHHGHPHTARQPPRPVTPVRRVRARPVASTPPLGRAAAGGSPVPTQPEAAGRPAPTRTTACAGCCAAGPFEALNCRGPRSRSAVRR
jgi:hypothetical protein